MGWCLLITALLVLGTKESARFNVVMTVLHMLLVVFIIIAGALVCVSGWLCLSVCVLHVWCL